MELKHVPGRKTDVQDKEWLAQLLECGLLKASFVLPPEIRDLRRLPATAGSAGSDPRGQPPVQSAGRCGREADLRRQ